MDTVREVLGDKNGTVYFTRPAATVFEAVEEMNRRRVGALLVLDGEKPVGIFSERDAMTRVLLAKKEPGKTAVREVMTREVVCVGSGTDALEAMAIMTNRRCRHLPVVDDGRVVGLLSIGDLVRWTSRNHAFEIQLLRDYITGKYPG